MMGIAMAGRELGPGERLALRHAQRTLRINLGMVGLALLVTGIGTLLLPQIGVPPATVRSLAAIALILISLVGGALCWRQADEFARAKGTRVLAVMGLIMFCGMPIAPALTRLGVKVTPDTVWAIALLAGAATAFWFWRNSK